ncbi:hypothetical protein M885DRAFT_611431 [Pelagophyceae sp. CCMP2097]|nr:hypothetical protein M885DRAFT_611431 [Pelagophyceae sp. CCMP2097]
MSHLRSYGASQSGLRASHGSDLDASIPRPKLPKTALPPGVRARMGLAPRREEDFAASEQLYKAGAGVLQPVGSAPDGTFLKRNSGVQASERTSALAQMRGDARARAVVNRAAVLRGAGTSGSSLASRDAAPRAAPRAVPQQRPTADGGRSDSGRPKAADSGQQRQALRENGAAECPPRLRRSSDGAPSERPRGRPDASAAYR